VSRTLISTRKVVKKLVFFFVLLRKTKKNTRSFTTFRVEINVLNIIKGRSSLFSEDFKRSDHETYNYSLQKTSLDCTTIKNVLACLLLLTMFYQEGKFGGDLFIKAIEGLSLAH
jgi:hypothetical protein